MTNDVHEKHITSITTPSDTEIRIERTFDAPPEVLWEAYTDPELLEQWLGPRDRPMTVEHMDVRPGGTYRWTTPGRDGPELAFFGEFRRVEPPRVLETTFNYSGHAGEPSIDRLEVEDIGEGRTRLVSTSTFATKEERDGMLRSGMERGVVEGYEALDELLARRPA